MSLERVPSKIFDASAPKICWHHLVTGFRAQEPLVTPHSGELKGSGIFGILGENGVGKSTFMRTIMNLMPPISGTVVHGPTVRCSYVPQVLRLHGHLHVNVADFLELAFHSPLAQKNQARGNQIPPIEATAIKWNLQHLLHKPVASLSSGERSRAFLARAMLLKPSVLFMDEPLAHLDASGQFLLFETLRELVKQDKLTVVLIDHHLNAFDRFLNGKFLFVKKGEGNPAVVTYTEKNCDHT